MLTVTTILSLVQTNLSMFLKSILVVALGAIGEFVSMFCSIPTSSAFCVAEYRERQCGRDMSRLWLDIAVVVDTSSGMSKGLPSVSLTRLFSHFRDFQIAANIATLFTKPNIGNGTVSTRVGLIGYNKEAQVVSGSEMSCIRCILSARPS